jgi:arylmalonate decarboxylase
MRNVRPQLVVGIIGPRPDTAFIAYQFYSVFPKRSIMVQAPLNLSGFSAERIDEALTSYWRCFEYLQDFKSDAIMLGGVPISAFAGRARMLELISAARSRTNAHVSTDLEEVVAAVRHLGLQRVAIATKWDSELLSLTRRYLEHAEVEVVATFGEAQTFDQLHALNIESSLDVALNVGARALRGAPTADGLLLLGGHWLETQAVISLEADFGKPVISNTTALFWSAMRARKLRCATPGVGRLMAGLDALA